MPLSYHGIFIRSYLDLFFFQNTETTLFYNNESYVIRQECWNGNLRNKYERIAFAWYQLLIMFLIPLIVMGYCYAIVIHVLWLSTKQLAKMTHGSRLVFSCMCCINFWIYNLQLKRYIMSLHNYSVGIVYQSRISNWIFYPSNEPPCDTNWHRPFKYVWLMKYILIGKCQISVMQ